MKTRGLQRGGVIVRLLRRVAARFVLRSDTRAVGPGYIAVAPLVLLIIVGSLTLLITVASWCYGDAARYQLVNRR